MTTIADLADRLQAVLTTTAEELARATGAVQRRAKLTGATLVQTVVLGWAQTPQASLSQLSQMAALLGAAVTPQALDQRFTAALADCLEAVLAAAVRQVVVSDPVAIPVLARFTAVTVQDSSTIALPAVFATRWRGTGHRHAVAASTAALKVQVRCDLCTGRLEGPLLEDGRAQDKVAALQDQQTAPLPAGALRLADLGYFSLDVLQALDAAGVFFLSRLQVQTAVFAATGQRVDVVAQLRRAGPAPVELAVQLGVTHRLPVRLLAVRVPQAVADERRRRLWAAARKKGQMVSKARLRWADWTIYVTNAPAALLTFEEAHVLYRARWQIELLFKLWKQHALVDEWRSAKPWRILCEVYAKLLAVVLQHWLLVVSCWRWPDKSLVKASHALRSHLPLLASAFAGVLSLATALAHLVRVLASGAGCRINPRKTAPNTYQLLLALEPPAPASPAARPPLPPATSLAPPAPTPASA
jgi:hypothetical protein